MKRFNNQTERAFHDFLISAGYAASTTDDYIRRLRRIGSLDVLVTSNLDNLISDYETGAHAEMNANAHRAYSCAIKRLQEYAERHIISVAP